MLRATIYVINEDGLPRHRVVRESDGGPTAFPVNVEAEMRANNELRHGERLEFGPITEPWRKL